MQPKKDLEVFHKNTFFVASSCPTFFCYKHTTSLIKLPPLSVCIDSCNVTNTSTNVLLPRAAFLEYNPQAFESVNRYKKWSAFNSTTSSPSCTFCLLVSTDTFQPWIFSAAFSRLIACKDASKRTPERIICARKSEKHTDSSSNDVANCDDNVTSISTRMIVRCTSGFCWAGWGLKPNRW